MSDFTRPDEFTCDPSDSREEQERKFRAYSEWSDRQARESRAGAIAHVKMIPLDVPLVRYLTDKEVRRTHELSQEMYVKLQSEGLKGASTLVLATLMVGMRNEQARREEAERQARIALEANGHEGHVVDDTCGWFAACSCDWAWPVGVDHVDTRQEAAAAVEAHFVEHGGGGWAAHTD